MHTNAAVKPNARTPHPAALSQHEVQRLLANFLKGKTQVLEEDCLTLVRWANAQRLGAVLVEMILDGEMVPSVVDGEVQVALPPHTRAGKNTRAVAAH